MQASLKLVSDRFAQFREQTRQAFERDPDFRDLCDEYGVCVATVARLEASTVSTKAMRSEYGVLLLRLERELLRCLVEHELLRCLDESPDRES